MNKELNNIKKILVINLGGIGDLLISTPALRAIKERFPGSCLYVLVAGRVKEAVADLGYIDDVFIIEPDRPWRKFFVNAGNLLKLRAAKIDLAINMRTMVSDSGAVKIQWIMNVINPGIKVGRDTAGRGGFFDINIPEQDIGEKYEMDYDIETAQALGAEVADRKIDLVVGPENQKRADDILKDHGIDRSDTVIGVHPGGKPSHRWPPDNFALVIKNLAQEFPLSRFVITGSPDEAALAERIIDKSGVKAANLAGRLTIRELAAVLTRCRLYIVNDTGSMHIGAIMHVPMVAIFGPGYLKRYDPRNISPEAVVLYRKEACSPCNKSACESMKCLVSIPAEEVTGAAKDVLNRKEKAQGI
jgi:ADP-heptose:LPS heptosyltransferase